MGKGKLVAVLVASLLAVSALWATILGLRLSPQLGLDLQGGVSANLIPAEGQGDIDQEILDQTVSIIRQRVDALGVAEPDITRQGETIQVQLPGVTDQEQARDVIGRTAQLQFRPVLDIFPPETGTPQTSETATAAAGAACDERQDDAVPSADEEVTLCERGVLPPAAPGDPPVELPRDQWNRLLLGPVEVGGSDLANARAEVDQATGLRWDVALELTGEGAQRFADITGRLACNPEGSPQRQLAIVLDNVVESAPPIASEVVCDQGIQGGRAVISVGGGEAEARDLALILRAGALPIQLDFGTFQSVSPTLGRNALNAGLLAGGIGLLLVAVYMIFLYRGIGLATMAELAMFGLVTYGLIIVLGHVAGFTLTLAGIAGIIVSIGIAADSSIIYRERYRDEARAGRTIRTAADHAFTKAFRTNLTGNTVSFLAAVVLYLLAVGPVRGFAFTLGLSTLVDTLLFATFTRSMFGLIARNPRLARSPLVGLRAGVTQPAKPTGSATP